MTMTAESNRTLTILGAVFNLFHCKVGQHSILFSTASTTLSEHLLHVVQCVSVRDHDHRLSMLTRKVCMTSLLDNIFHLPEYHTLDIKKDKHNCPFR